MNDDSVIELLEKSAAFNRDKKIVENLRKGTPLPQTTGLSPEPVSYTHLRAQRP
mgnify:CR=1 FL=1